MNHFVIPMYAQVDNEDKHWECPVECLTLFRGGEHMTYEQALQIAIESLDNSVEYIRAFNKGFPRVQKQADELALASDVLRKALEAKLKEKNT